MGDFMRISSGTPWEPVAGYSRAVRFGNFVAVSGTTATDDRGLVIGEGQMYVQARQALINISSALERAGLSMRDVVRTRMFVTDISRFAEAARAHREFFGETPPATTMVEVRRLVNPRMLIEIEADAYVAENPVGEAREESRVAASAPARKRAAKKPRGGAKSRPR